MNLVRLGLLCAVAVHGADVLEEDGDDAQATLTYQLEHALSDENDVFTPRGSLTVRLPRFTPPGKKRPAPVVLRPDPLTLSAEDAAAFGALVTRGGLYRVRLRESDGGDKAPVMNSLRACELAISGMEEDMTLILDEEGQISGLDYGTSQGFQGCTSGAAPAAGELQLKTRADAVLPRLAAAVPIQSKLAPKGGAAAAVAPNSQAALAAASDPDAPAEEAPQPGFFRRYWYIIVPAMLFIMVGEPPPDDSRGGGRGGGGSGSGVEAAPRRVHPSKRS